MKKLKRLSLDLIPEDHKAIKKRALDQNMPMKEWIMRAIKDQIIKEEQLGWKYE